MNVCWTLNQGFGLRDLIILETTIKRYQKNRIFVADVPCDLVPRTVTKMGDVGAVDQCGKTNVNLGNA